MIQWERLDAATPPSGQGEITLYRRGAEFSIRADGRELMNSRRHGSESAMAGLACSDLAQRPAPRVLVGGLGMGFTLAATNAVLPLDAQIDVVELLGAVVAWNRGPLADLAGRPLDDPRVRVIEADVCDLVRAPPHRYDAILLDIDNGPDGFTQASNAWLYAAPGLACLRAALRAGGVLCVWSATPDSPFTRRLRAAGFSAETHAVAARSNGKGPLHTVWVATADSGA